MGNNRMHWKVVEINSNNNKTMNKYRTYKLKLIKDLTWTICQPGTIFTVNQNYSATIKNGIK